MESYWIWFIEQAKEITNKNKTGHQHILINRECTYLISAFMVRTKRNLNRTKVQTQQTHSTTRTSNDLNGKSRVGVKPPPPYYYIINHTSCTLL